MGGVFFLLNRVVTLPILGSIANGVGTIGVNGMADNEKRNTIVPALLAIEPTLILAISANTMAFLYAVKVRV